MSNWKVGDKALCVKVGPLDHQTNDAHKNLPPLRLNAKYCVNEVHICSCGNVSLDVGLGQNSGNGTRCECGAISAPSWIHWCSAKRFVKEASDTEENENVEEKIKEAVAAGNQELVDELLDKLNK